MKSMKLSPKEKKAIEKIYTSAPSEPEYPYGLRLNLEEDQLAKLDLEQLPEVGATMTITATVEVCGVSKYEDENGKRRSLSLQITALELQ